MTPKKAPEMLIEVGDTVKHIRFGWIGVCLEIRHEDAYVEWNIKGEKHWVERDRLIVASDG
jgi:hypothetical protein